MPFYEVFAIAKPKLASVACFEVLRGAATVLLKSGAILTDIKNHGERPLAYTIRRPGQAYNEAFMWQMGFMADPRVLKDLEHQLKVDERVLRHMVFRKRALPKLPNTYKLAREAKQLLEEIEPEEQYESEEQYTSEEQSESE